MRLHIVLLALLAAALLAACGTTAGAPAAPSDPGVASADGSIRVSGAWARLPGAAAQPTAAMGGMAGTSPAGGAGHTDSMADMGGVGAAYMTIRNSGAAADRLLKVEGDVAKSIELHSVVDNAGVMQMRPVAEIAIPAGGEAQLKPGGLHVMMIGLQHQLKPGDKVGLTLTFEKAGRLSVQAEVREQ